MTDSVDNLVRKLAQHGGGCVAIPTFTCGAYARLLEVADDRDRLPNEYLTWADLAVAATVELIARGIVCAPVDIDVGELVIWCRTFDRPIDASARAQFAAVKLRELCALPAGRA